MATVKNTWSTGDNVGATDLNAIGSAINTIVDGAAGAYVATSEATTSTSYTDLTTTTDSVTVTIGASGKAVVFISAWMTHGSASGLALMGFALSGATTQAAADNLAIGYQEPSTAGGTNSMAGAPFLVTGLALGSTTFKAKYRTYGAGTATFQYRRIAVIPL